MSVTFRFATPDELSEVGRLISHSFPLASRTPAWWSDGLQQTDYGDGPDIVWVGEEKGRIVAACQLHRLLEWIAGEPLPTLGLGTVVISPTHRKHGLAGEMTAAALLAGRSRGDVGSALFPFRASFYQRLGYGLAGEAHQYRVSPEVFPASNERKRVELAESPRERAEVRQFYEQWARTQTGQIMRSERLWDRLLESPIRALVAYRNPDNQMEGYALVAYRTDLPPRDRYLEVEELAWLSPEARDGLHGWLGSLGDQWQSILLRSLPSHRLGDRLGGPRLSGETAPGWGLWFPSATLLRGPMFRLLDMEGAWRRRTVAADISLTLALDVRDEQIPENSGAWRLRLDGGAVSTEKGNGQADISLSLGVDTLSRIFIGDLAPSAAVQADLAQATGGEHLSALDMALRLPDPWTFDRF